MIIIKRSYLNWATFNLEMEWEARLFYNWQLCLPADGCNLLHVPNTDSRISEFVVKTEKTNIYHNYNICALNIVSQPFNPPWLENTECLFFLASWRSLFTNTLRNISSFKKYKARPYRNSSLFSYFLVNLYISQFREFGPISSYSTQIWVRHRQFWIDLRKWSSFQISSFPFITAGYFLSRRSFRDLSSYLHNYVLFSL